MIQNPLIRCWKSTSVDKSIAQIQPPIRIAPKLKKEGIAPRRKKLTLYGVCTNDVGENSSIYYCTWRAMIQRCFSKTWRADPKHKFDMGTTLCDEWKLYSNFRAWMQTHDDHISGRGLSKGILIPGNSVFAPDKCVFVPKKISNLLKAGRQSSTRAATLAQQLLGVEKIGQRYRVRANFDGKQTTIGFSTSKKEAHLMFLKAKAESMLVSVDTHLTDDAYDVPVKAVLRNLAQKILARIAQPDFDPTTERLW